MTVDRFNALPAAEARRELMACCASPEWARRVADGRPYPDVAALMAAAGRALADLPWEEVALALAAHPRIGERPAGNGREAAWSRREQSGVAVADTPTLAALAQANREYEQRFGHVFLIFASGATAERMLTAARQRLRHDPDTERQVVRAELARIVALRVERMVS